MCKSPSWGTAGERRFDCSQRGAVHQLTDQKVSIRVVETLVSHGAVACVDMHRDTVACLWVSCPTNSCQTLQRSVEGYTAPITPYIKYSEHPIPSHPIAWRCKGYTRLSHIEKTRFRNRHRTHIYLHKVSLLFWKVKRAPTKLCNPSE